VFFEYDLSGIIQVTIVDLTTNNILTNFTLDRIRNLDENNIQLKRNRISRLSVN